MFYRWSHTYNFTLCLVTSSLWLKTLPSLQSSCVLIFKVISVSIVLVFSLVSLCHAPCAYLSCFRLVILLRSKNQNQNQNLPPVSHETKTCHTTIEVMF